MHLTTRLSFLALLFMPTLGTSDSIVVVPGSNAGFLYFPAGTNVGDDSGPQKFTVVINKTGHYTDYKIVSEPPGLVIQPEDMGGQYDFEIGAVTLKLEGKYPTQGMQNVDIVGDWAEHCVAESNRECNFTLTGISGVTVSVNDTMPIGSRFEIDNEGTPLSVYFAGLYDNKPMIVHPDYQSGVQLVPAKDTETRPIIDDPNDGAANTLRWLSIYDGPLSAASYCNNLRGNWFLPARHQLTALSNFPPSVLTDFVSREYTWSSTVKEAEEKKGSLEKTKIYAIKVKNGGFDKMSDEDAHKGDKGGAVCMARLN